MLVSAGDLWACVLELNSIRRWRGDKAVASYQQLCAELTKSGPACFGELSVVGARSVLRRYSDAYFNAAKAPSRGDLSARFPRRKHRLVPVRFYAGTFCLQGRSLRLPVAAGGQRLRVRLSRPLPYSHGELRSVTVVAVAGKLYADATAEVPVARYDQAASHWATR
jgi:hypothetical protein